VTSLPHAGGMGACARREWLVRTAEDRIGREIAAPVPETLRGHGTPLRGTLYCGLMRTAAGRRCAAGVAACRAARTEARERVDEVPAGWGGNGRRMRRDIAASSGPGPVETGPGGGAVPGRSSDGGA